MDNWFDSLEPRFLLAGGPTVIGFKISPRSPEATSGSIVFTITYFDVNGIDPTSLDNRDVRVAGPNDYARYATAFASLSSPLGNQRAVRYKIAPRGGAWDSSDNGTYTVRLRGGEVFDQQGNTSDPRLLGSFGVNIPSGGATPRASGVSASRISIAQTIDLLE